MVDFVVNDDSADFTSGIAEKVANEGVILFLGNEDYELDIIDGLVDFHADPDLNKFLLAIEDVLTDNRAELLAHVGLQILMTQVFVVAVEREGDEIADFEVLELIGVEVE